MSVIEITDLSFSYTPSSPFVLSDITFSVDKGDYISIVGGNGAGKSTLIKLILGLIPPSKGSIQNFGKRMGYVPQRFENINLQFPITVNEVLLTYQKACGIKEKNAVNHALEMVKMGDFKHRLIGSLSGGQCQKIFIARSLIGDPDLLIFDEHSTSIDTKSQTEIYALIKKINVECGITVISVDHNLLAAVQNSTLIYHLSEGKGHYCSPEDFMKENIIDYTKGVN